MWRLFALLVLAALALATAPAVTADVDIDARPWPAPVLRVAALGRAFAAADVAWLKTVQLLGSDAQARQRYPHLEQWIDLITGLDASFEEPYFFGAMLLVTDTERAPVVDRLLARGEGAFPRTFSFPMMRGFLAQFGLLDAKQAAAHYARAAALPGAPPYLAAHARRLASEELGCGSVMDDLKSFAASASSAQARALAENRFAILEHCFEGLIYRTAVRFRLNNPEGRHATLEDVERELGYRIPAPPGRCWTVAFDKGSLGPCPEATTP